MVPATFAIRAMEPADLDEWLRLRNLGYPWPSDRARLVFGDSLRPPDEPLLRLGAWTEDGALAGTAECYVGEDGERWIDRAESFVLVAPPYRRLGLAGRLVRAIGDFAKAHDVRWLEAVLRERDLDTARALLQREGFGELERDRQSVQRPATVDVSALDPLRAHLRQTGIETAVFSAIDSPASRRALYRCTMAIEHDMPHAEHSRWDDPTFESWIKKTFEHPGAMPDAIFVARDGDEVVGMTNLVRRADGDLEVGDTGVIPSHRRRGIAHALKLMATRFAAERGIPHVHTDNRTDNAGMLAINAELGFQPGETILVFEKTLR